MSAYQVIILKALLWKPCLMDELTGSVLADDHAICYVTKIQSFIFRLDLKKVPTIYIDIVCIRSRALETWTKEVNLSVIVLFSTFCQKLQAPT